MFQQVEVLRHEERRLQSKDELLFPGVNPSDVEGIKSLGHDGAGLEDAQATTVIPLWKANLEEQRSDHNSTSPRPKPQRRRGYISQARRWAQVDRRPATKGHDLKQLNWFCEGIPQPMNHPTTENISSNELTPSVPVTAALDEGYVPSTNSESTEDGRGSGVCVICVDASSEAACVPCGHVAGCVSCLKQIKNKKLGCPICRANIDLVIKLYLV